MNVLSWLTGHFSNRGKALSLYRRGMAKSKNHEHQGAIDDYTTAIGMRDAPPDVKAMALYNRALVYAAAGDRPNATADLNTVLEMPEALPNIKAEAKRKLVRMER
jgi:tetratricopeptide (TPR) repeat protein